MESAISMLLLPMPMTELGTLADLHPDPKNARQRTQRGHGMIVRSLQAVGAARSVVVDETNMLLAGHGVTDGAAEIGIDKVLFVDVDGETIVAVRRSGLTPEQKKQLAYYDNRTSELAEWDAAQMMADLELGLNLDDMFRDEEIREMMNGVPFGDTSTDRDGQDVASPWYKYKTDPDRQYITIGEMEVPISGEILERLRQVLEARFLDGVAYKETLETILAQGLDSFEDSAG